MKSVPALLALLFSIIAAVGKTPVTFENGFSVCIDPGHPSENSDGGAVTQGLREVTVNWQVAQLLQRELKDARITVVMTKKSEGEFVTNKDRATIANENHADLFLRLHADAGNSSGFTVYYPRQQGSIHGITGPSPDVLKSSSTAATLFHKGFAAELNGKLRDNGIRGDEQTLIGSRQGALTGSIFSKVPTILVEMVFLTNPADANWLKEESNHLIMAKALAAGVCAIRDEASKR